MVIPFPEDKAERERVIARLFTGAFSGYVATQSEPSLAPFGEAVQNSENDLDFNVQTAAGEKLMELVEFAPLDVHGPKFETAPKELHPRQKAPLAFDQIKRKSDHQGGPARFLVVYTTEHGFWIDPITVERVRRMLLNDPPDFERVYYVSPHDLEHKSVSETYPGRPHHICGEWADEEFDVRMVVMPHPTQMEVRRTVSFEGKIRWGDARVPIRITLDVPASLRRA